MAIEYAVARAEPVLGQWGGNTSIDMGGVMEAMRIRHIPTDEEIRTFYNECASHGPMQERMYQTGAQRDRLRRLKRILSCMLPLAGRVLEMGCNDGKMSAWIAERCGFLQGFDIAESCVARCQALALDNASFLTGDLSALARPQDKWEPFDIAVATQVLEHQRSPIDTILCLSVLADVVVASVPIAERPNDDGAFSVKGYLHPKKSADGTGHIWAFRPDTFRALFDKVYHYEDNGYSAIVVGR